LFSVNLILSKIIIFLKDDICYVSNVGDSRAIMSISNGKSIDILSNDHKPGMKEEENRIIQAGGKVYQYIFNF